MKIGILTLPFNNNYGGYMQAYALMTVLKLMGHEPTLIMRRHNPYRVSIVFRIKFFIKGILKTIIRHKIYPCFYGKESSFRARGKNMLTFVDKYIQPQTRYIYSTDELRKECEDRFDAYIVGSDQVWRPIYVPGLIGNMFLDFTNGWNVKRIAYAASFGTDKWEYSQKQTDAYKQLVSSFNLITVREDSAVKLCEERFGVNSYHVLDPTMLLSKEDYKHIVFQSHTSRSPGNLFYYILDPNEEKLSFVKKISKHLDLSPFTILPKYQKETLTYSAVKNKIEDCIYPSVESWLRAFVDSEMIICDSFHGCVFSIIFNKPFWVLENKNRGNTRFESLLKLFGLENRLIDLNMFSIVDINKPVEWNNINKALLKLSIYSQELLLKSLC